MTKTIGQLDEALTLTADDMFETELVSGNLPRRVKRSVMVGANISGNGNIATGGYPLTVAGPTTVNGSLVGNLSGAGFTLTVPATGTAALLGVAQSFTALKTFSSGLSFGQTTLQNYQQGTWTPTITGTTNPTIVLASSLGKYTRIGNIVHYWAFVTISSAPVSGGSGNARFSLPFAPVADNPGALGSLWWYDGSAQQVPGGFVISGANIYGNALLSGLGFVTCSNLAANQWWGYSGSYPVA